MAGIKINAGKLPTGVSQTKAHEFELFEGDKVQVGITSVVRIKGDDNWIRMEIATTVREGETGTEAMKRAKGFVHQQFSEYVPETAHLIMEMDE